MDRHERFAVLAEAASDDREHGLPGRRRFQEGPVGIRPVRLPGGGSATLMRVMQTNDQDGNLSLDRDPKTAWALAHPDRFPVALERAPYEMLLRVPGIGPTAARRLIRERRSVVLRDADDFRGLGANMRRAGYFVTLKGRRLARVPPPEQLRLFPHGAHLPSVVWRTPVPPCAYR